MEKIVIMLSTFNGERYLNEQLKSIANQKIDDYEIILYVRDDGSTDSTMQILKKWGKKININFSLDSMNYSMGPAKSFWYLLKTAPVGDYYAFVDQDDIWDSDKLFLAIQSLKNQDKSSLWISNSRLIDDKGNETGELFNKEEPIFTLESQLVCGSIQGCSMVFNRKLYSEILEKDYRIIPMHDTVIMLHTLIQSNCIYDHSPHFSYRVHSNNVVAQEGKSKMNKIKNSLNFWFSKNNIHLITNFIKDFQMVNQEILTKETSEYLYKFIGTKTKLSYRFWIIFNNKTKSTNKKGLRSFRLRTLLGII